MLRKHLLPSITIIVCLLFGVALVSAQNTTSEVTPDNTPGSTMQGVLQKDTPVSTATLIRASTNTPTAVNTHTPTRESTPEATPTASPESRPQATPTMLESNPEVAAWTAWVYERATGRVVLINSEGKLVLEFTLQMPFGYDTYPEDIAVSPDGVLIAYVVAHGTTGSKRLIVSDWRTNEIISTNTLTPLWISETEGEYIVFHETDENLALGYSQYHPDWQFSLNADGELVLPEDGTLAFGQRLVMGRWEIVIYDPLSDETLRTLYSDSPVTAAVGIAPDAKQTPIVLRYRDDAVYFILVPDEADDADDGRLTPYAGYVWNTTTNTVCPSIAYGALPMYTDTLPATGEVIMALSDPALPNHQDDFSSPQRNALYIYDPTLDAIYPFYNTSYYSLVNPRFIQNGARILIGVADRNGNILWWRVIDQSGESQTEYTGRYRSDAEFLGVPDGYIALEQNTQGETYLFHQITSHRIRGFKADVIWYGDSTASPHFIWQQSGIEPPTHFDIPWAQLAEPIYGDGECPESETGGAP